MQAEKKAKDAEFEPLCMPQNAKKPNKKFNKKDLTASELVDRAKK